MKGRAIAFGEALIDEFPDRRVVAGAPLHVAARLASFGWHSYLLTRIGQDTDGLEIAETLRVHGVDTSLVEIDDELPTGVTSIEFEGTKHAFTIGSPAAWDAIEGPDPVPSHDVLYFGTLALRDSRSLSAWQRIVAASTAMKVVDINLRAPYYDGEVVGEVTAAADLLKANDTELGEITDFLGMPSEPRALFDMGPTWVCVTHGAEGAELLHRDGGHWSEDGIEADIVDTVGAGDAFTAAMVDALVAGVDGGSALNRANRYAASTVERRGGLPEPVDEPPRASPLL
jgi:fructokinase